MPPLRPFLLALAVLACAHGAARAQPEAQQAVPGRGQLLYEAHCVECHTMQMHWRDAKAARDWDGIRVQVQAWQGRLRLNWPADDVDAVARYLNGTVYRYPAPREQAGLRPDAALASRATRAGPAPRAGER